MIKIDKRRFGGTGEQALNDIEAEMRGYMGCHPRLVSYGFGSEGGENGLGGFPQDYVVSVWQGEYRLASQGERRG